VLLAASDVFALLRCEEACSLAVAARASCGRLRHALRIYADLSAASPRACASDVTICDYKAANAVLRAFLEPR
jgi:hypothetical protein